MSPQPRAGDVGLLTPLTHVRSLIVMESLVESQVNELRETLIAFITGVRLLTLVKSHVRLKIGI